jgi:hypothetical protein
MVMKFFLLRPVRRSKSCAGFDAVPSEAGTFVAAERFAPGKLFYSQWRPK